MEFINSFDMGKDDGVGGDTWIVGNIGYWSFMHQYPPNSGSEILDIDSSLYNTTISVMQTVPEPGTLALLGIGLFSAGLARRRKI